MEIVKPQLFAQRSRLLVKFPLGLSILVNGGAFPVLRHDSVRKSILHPGACIHKTEQERGLCSPDTFQRTCHIFGLNFRRINLLTIYTRPRQNGKMRLQNQSVKHSLRPDPWTRERCAGFRELEVPLRLGESGRDRAKTSAPSLKNRVAR